MHSVAPLLALCSCEWFVLLSCVCACGLLIFWHLPIHLCMGAHFPGGLAHPPGAFYARRMGQPTLRATRYTARSNIEPAQIFLHANGQSATRSGGARNVGRGAGSHTLSTASEFFSLYMYSHIICIHMLFVYTYSPIHLYIGANIPRGLAHPTVDKSICIHMFTHSLMY